MPEIPNCTWEWDGTKWTKISGPSWCNTAPPPPRADPGERITVNCTPPT